MTYDQEQELVDFRAFLTTHGVSPENTRAVISVVTRLVKGHGLCLPNVKEVSFLADEPIGPLHTNATSTLSSARPRHGYLSRRTRGMAESGTTL